MPAPPRNLFCCGLLRSARMIRGVLHTYSFRANAKLVPRQHPDTQVGDVENTAPGWSARGITLPSRRLRAHATVYFWVSSSDVHMCRGAFCMHTNFERARNYAPADPPDSQVGEHGNMAQKGARGGNPYPPGLPGPTLICSWASSLDLRGRNAAFCIRTIFEQARNSFYADPPTRK